jgi:hypothetical protein
MSNVKECVTEQEELAEMRKNAAGVLNRACMLHRRNEVKIVWPRGVCGLADDVENPVLCCCEINEESTIHLACPSDLIPLEDFEAYLALKKSERRAWYAQQAQASDGEIIF